MTIWTHPITLEDLRQRAVGTAIEHLGIEFLEIGDDFLSGRLLVDRRTRQPFGILHGGVSVVLAETLGSVGATYSCPAGHTAVGLEINANHLRAVSSGWVTGIARPLHRGRSTQVWQIEMRDEAGRMNCVSRITMSILAPAATA